jgi:alkanesulfonate monooxygenase SsuD/methylene tetrahydromethanopterin reductase-like flavin-dependent oxidoreductase (luciferase family)
MKFDMFYEIQHAPPFVPDHERVLFEETMEQARVSDRAGYEAWWQVEHNATPQFSYSSAPDLWLAAVALNTKRIRVGHAGIIARFAVNHPLRVGARTGTLDLLSNGRLECGLAVSGAREWLSYGAPLDNSAEEYQEFFEMLPKLWTEEFFQWGSKNIKIPRRAVVPKPIQKPHPPLWQTAGSPQSFRAAGRRGIGVLGLTIMNPIESMKNLLDEYEAGIAECKQPVGHFMNKQKAVFTFVHVAESRKKAIENGAAWSALWYVLMGPKSFQGPLSAYFNLFKMAAHPTSNSSSDYKQRILADGEPDPTNLEPEPDDIEVVSILKLMAKGEKVSFERAHECLEQIDSIVIGDPDECRAKFQKYADIGTDRMMCMMQFGSIPHKEVIRSIELCSEHMIPAFRNQKAV